MTQQPTYLYHYTTVDAFVSIIEKRELWATNIFYLNDTMEFHLAITLAKQLLHAIAREEGNGEHQRQLGDVRRLLNDVRPGVTTEPCCFVCSFSDRGDDLNQWRAYCRQGGVALGFRRDNLKQMMCDPDYPGYIIQYAGDAPRLVSCIYKRKDQKDLVHKCLEDMLRPRASIDSMSYQQVTDCRARLLKLLLVEQPIKHSDFRGEHECRLILSPDSGLVLKGDEHLKSRSRNGRCIPYWEVKLPNDIWREVHAIVGPCPHPQETKAAIESLLRHKVNPHLRQDQVRNSKVPYRWW